MSLTFDTKANEKSDFENLALAKNILSRNVELDYYARKTETFTSLVHALRSVDFTDLSLLLEWTNERNSRKLLLDALPLIKTDAAVKVMTVILNSKEMTYIEEESWFKALAYYKNPTRTMVELLGVS